MIRTRDDQNEGDGREDHRMPMLSLSGRDGAWRKICLAVRAARRRNMQRLLAFWTSNLIPLRFLPHAPPQLT